MLRRVTSFCWQNSFVCSAILAALAPAWSSAEIIQESGSLQRGDNTIREGQYADTFEIESEGGERIQVILMSENFDTYLIFAKPSGDEVENDDAGSTELSMVRASLAEAGTYQVTVSSFSSGETGDYELIIRTEPSDARIEEGRLGPKGPRTYDIEGEAGQRASITLTSDDFDTVVRLLGPSGLVAENDDSGDGTNSQIEIALPETGTYQVEVDSFGGGEDGRYELSIDIGAPFDIAEQGALSRDDDTLESGEFCDTYTFEANAGDFLEAYVTSSEFDTYLILESPSGQQWDNDDFGSGTDSGMIRVLDEAGIYQVTVTTFTTGETGAYSLSVDVSESGEAGGRPPKP